MMPGKLKFGTGAGGGGGGGGGGGSVSLSNLTITKIGGGTGSVTGTYTISSDGNIYNQAGAKIGTWLNSGSAANYQVEATQTSGTTITGAALGSWLLCSTSRSWSVTATAGQVNGATMTVQIRDVATQTVRATATITFDVENA